MNFERVKKNWTSGLLNVAGLKQFYRVGIITKDQYREIKALPQAGQGN
jgi:hypothetical protein